MTWDEFKSAVDKALAEQGHRGDVTVERIDLQTYRAVEGHTVSVTEMWGREPRTELYGMVIR